jgi:predicted nucleic acid-binding Zn ribbon protein
VSALKQHYHGTKAALCLHQRSIIKGLKRRIIMGPKRHCVCTKAALSRDQSGIVSAPKQHYHGTNAELCLHESSIIMGPKRHCVCTKAALSWDQSGIVSAPNKAVLSGHHIGSVSAPKQHFHGTNPG